MQPLYFLDDEQPGSFAESLAEAGVRHGDTVLVQIATGVLPQEGKRGAHLAYCSSRIRLKRVIQVGSAEERSQSIVGRVEYEQPEVLAKKLHGHRGMVVMDAIVHSNGHIRVAVDARSVKRVPLPHVEPFELQTSDGKVYADEALVMV